ncbi:MAG TPA: hypothetical protein VGB96_06080 [Archangium sp.]
MAVSAVRPGGPGLRARRDAPGWDAPIKDVVAPTSLGSLTATRLIQEAELDTHLRSAPGARVLSRSDDAGASVTRVLLRGLLLPLFFVGVFVAAAFIGRWWDENDGRQRPSQMPATRRDPLPPTWGP